MANNKIIKKPYALRRTIQRVEHNGQEYLVDKIIDTMNEGHKLSQAIKINYPDLPKASVAPLMGRIKKHPYYIAYKDASMKILNDKGPALQQNMLDLALNSRSDMVKFSATKDALDRVYGEADATPKDITPIMTFNFSFGGSAPVQQATIDPDRIIDGDTL